MKRSVAVPLTLLATLTGCWDTNPDDEQQKTPTHEESAATCTSEADSDVDCMPADGGHSEGTKQAYFSDQHSSGGSTGGSNAFLWYWLGTQNSRTVYVAPPAAASYAPAPTMGARTGESASFRPSPALSARGGFGSAGSGGSS